MNLAAEGAVRERVHGSVHAACLIEEKLVVGKFIKGGTMRVAVLVGSYVHKGVDKQIELSGRAVGGQPAREDSAVHVEVLDIGGKHLVAIIVLITVTILRFEWNGSNCNDQESYQ